MTSPFALIVEDTPDMAAIMEMALDRVGVAHHHVDDGPSALAFLETRTPDLLLLDIGLPGMSGWRVLEAIQDRFPDTIYPVIVLTAFDDPANKLVGRLQERVVRYITKPFLPSVLSDAVRETLRLNDAP